MRSRRRGAVAAADVMRCNLVCFFSFLFFWEGEGVRDVSGGRLACLGGLAGAFGLDEQMDGME